MSSSPAAPEVVLNVWSDVLCPWCYNAAVVLDRLETEASEKDPERFRRYTETWMRPAGAPEAARFRVWSTDEAPPSHSVPPAAAVVAAERQSDGRAFHLALMDAYFWENRNVTARETIVDVAAATGLDVERFSRDLDDPAVTAKVWEDYRAAVHYGISSVPTVLVGEDFALPGAQDSTFYRRLFEKLAERAAEAS
jgi:predicted DsbA family dithiol-disulfide isomerase